MDERKDFSPDWMDTPEKQLATWKEIAEERQGVIRELYARLAAIEGMLEKLVYQIMKTYGNCPRSVQSLADEVRQAVKGEA